MSDLIQNANNTQVSYMEALKKSQVSSRAPSQDMGQADFLRLLTTQMQNQDPSKPMDPTNFVTDLTQMSQLEASTKMNESIMAMAESFKNLQAMQGSSLIGKHVQIEGDKFSHAQERDSHFELLSDEPFIDINIVISDDDGIVKEMNYKDFLSEQEQASWTGLPSKPISWDGLDDVGAKRDSGEFTITAYGTDVNGETKSINTVVASRVNSIAINSDSTMTLTLATGEKISMDSVREISG